MSSDDVSISWAHGEFSIVREGAMCAPAIFDLGDGKRVQPFAIAPWQDDGSDEFENLPQLLKRLRGEWVCVPFGMPQTRQDVPSAWRTPDPTGSDLGDWFHGPGSNEAWTVVDLPEGGVVLELVYPDQHPIRRLVRRIIGSVDQPRLDFELEVHPRRDCRLPIGVHPVFKLPVEPMQAKLNVEGDITVHTYPVDAEPGVSKLPHDQAFPSLNLAKFANGRIADLSRHPMAEETEEIVLVLGASGAATLDNLEEGYRVALNWDPQKFGNCNLWISNKGRQYYPWNGRFQALGIEPVSAPFDLGHEAANAATSPLNQAGVPCTVQFHADQPWNACYSIGVTRL